MQEQIGHLQLKRWLNDDVTQLIAKVLEKEKEEVIGSLLEGYHMEDSHFERRQAHLLGDLKRLNELLVKSNFEDMLERHNLLRGNE